MSLLDDEKVIADNTEKELKKRNPMQHYLGLIKSWFCRVKR